MEPQEAKKEYETIQRVLESIKFDVRIIEELPKECSNVVVTHSGSFHCDDACSIGLLTYLQEFRNSPVVRISHREANTNKKVMQNTALVVDIGWEYEEGKNHFDHHQKGFNETFSNKFKTKLSGCGLVYKHFGKRIIRQFCKELDVKITGKELDKLYVKMYENFIEHIDANDNGIEVGTDIKFTISTALPSRISRLNVAKEQLSFLSQNEQFNKAAKMCRLEFFQMLSFEATAWLSGRKIIENWYNEATLGGRVMEMDRYIPWKSHVFDIEEENGKLGNLLFVIWLGDRNNSWRMIAVPKKLHTFDERLRLPGKWRGLKQEELSKVVGIQGCTFVHVSGFTGGHETKEGVLKMCALAMKDVGVIIA